jgi:hypothetical protein
MVPAADGQRGEITTSVIFRSKSWSSRKMPEFPTWNSELDDRCKDFSQPPLMIPAFSFLSSGETDQRERGHHLPPDGETRSHRICLINKFMMFLWPEKVKYSLILKWTGRAANNNKRQGCWYLVTRSLQLQPEQKYGDVRFLIVTELNRNLNTHKNSSSLLYSLRVSVVMVLSD